MRRFNIPELESAENLRDLYLDKKLSTPEIGKKYGVNPDSVRYRLQKYKISLRSRGEAVSIRLGNHVKLSCEATSFLYGELLGDGFLSRGNYSSIIDYGSKYREYLEWLSKQLCNFGIQQGGKIYHKTHVCSPAYQYHSKSYIELKPIRDLFYPEGKKIVPRSLILDPLMLRQFYIGDGSLIFPSNTLKSKPFIRLATHGFPPDDVEFLVQLLRDLRFFAIRYLDNSIRISSYSAGDFLRWIKPCPPEIESIYGYKFHRRENPNQLKMEF